MLTHHENITSETLNREPHQITEADINNAITLCDANLDGKITKSELCEWIKTYMQRNKKLHKESHEVLKRTVSIRKDLS